MGAVGLQTHIWNNNPRSLFLLIGFLTSLLIVSFVRSSIINNDLGWRIIWFAQFAAMIWTAAVVQSMAPQSSFASAGLSSARLAVGSACRRPRAAQVSRLGRG